MASDVSDIKSPMAEAMGAKIKITGPARGMYLIIGDGDFLDSDVKGAGGEIAIRFNGSKMLAALPFAGYLALKSQRRISHIGPVTVDLKRLAQVANTLAKASNNGSNGPG